MAVRLKKQFIRLLEEDTEFRYTVAGYIGLSDITRSLERLHSSLEKLAEAQARAESRIKRLEAAVERLAEAQKETELRIGTLAEAQARTESRIDRLEIAVEKLAEAQSRTENTLRELAIQVGRLSDTISFGLEDIARVVMPGWLQRHEGVIAEELTRHFVTVDGKQIEINLYGEGLKDGETIVIFGESRSRIYGKDVEDFDKRLENVLAGIPHRIYKFMFGYWIHPSANVEAEKRNIRLIASYMR